MSKPLDPQAFEAARAAFVYHILSQIQTPSSRADNFGWYAVEGSPTYAPGSESGEYLKAAQSLDPAYVADMAASICSTRQSCSCSDRSRSPRLEVPLT